jgi:hypothetical protein
VITSGGNRIEAESLRPKHAKISGGELRTQDMAGFKNDTWSGGAQLFWVSVQLGHTLTLTVPDIAPGTQDITLVPTLARDYGRFRILINGEIQEVDLYTGGFVKLAPPVTFRNVPVSPSEPLKIVIEPIGANPEAKIGKYGFVFGLDRIEVGAKVAPKTSAISFRTSGPSPKELVRFEREAQPGSGVIVPSGAYFHPIRTPSGIEVTALAPKAHPYYRGLFMGYVETHGVKDANFWGGGGGPIKGSAIVNTAVSDVQPTGFQATNQWRYADVALVNEDLHTQVDLRAEATVIDLTYTFTSLADFRLGHCNVGGLALPVRTDGKLTAHGPAGPVTLPSAVYRKDESNWPAADWYGYTMELPDGQTVSAAILNHPSNPDTRWHCALGARVINPCITTFAERLLKPDSPLTLRYRVVALDGAFDSGKMSELVSEWKAGPEP